MVTPSHVVLCFLSFGLEKRMACAYPSCTLALVSMKRSMFWEMTEQWTGILQHFLYLDTWKTFSSYQNSVKTALARRGLSWLFINQFIQKKTWKQCSVCFYHKFWTWRNSLENKAVTMEINWEDLKQRNNMRSIFAFSEQQKKDVTVGNKKSQLCFLLKYVWGK